MCYLKPLRVEKIQGKTVLLTNGLKAFYDRKIGEIKPNDEVLVYGNLVVSKYDKKIKN